MGMGRPAYARGQGSFLAGENPSGLSPFGGGIGGGLYGAFRPMRSPRMPMPPMNRPPSFMGRTMPQGPQMPMDEGYDGSGFMGGLMARMPTPSRPPPQMPMDETVYTPQMPQGPQGPRMPQIPIPQIPMPPMQRPGGPGKGRPRGGLMRRGRGSLMRGGPGKGRGQMQRPMPQPSGGFFLGNMLNNAMSQGQIGQPQQSFMGRVANNMPQEPRRANQGSMPLPLSTMGFYGGGITDLY